MGIFSQQKTERMFLPALYLCAFFFFSFKVGFYTVRVSRTPDEYAHISYVAYLTQNRSIVPDMRQMKLLTATSVPDAANRFSARNGYANRMRFSNSLNYLFHPPLYYQLIRLSGGVRCYPDGTFQIDLLRMRAFSIALALVAILLVLYAGYSRLDGHPLDHLVYAVACVSVPGLAYVCSGVSNDTLSFLAMALLLLGSLRFSEGQRGYATMFLIAGGVVSAMLNKATAALMALLFAVFFLARLLKRERSLRFLLSRPFLATLPLYALGAAYYGFTWIRYGSFQPVLQNVSFSDFAARGLYKPLASSAQTGFGAYTASFFSSFFQTWAGIFSHVSLLKPRNPFRPDQIALNLLWLLPAAVYLPARRSAASPFRGPIGTVTGCMYPAALLCLALQLAESWLTYLSTGYSAGFQSRYFYCVVPFFALSAALALQKIRGGQPVPHRPVCLRGDGPPKVLRAPPVERGDRARLWVFSLAAVAFCGLLIYEDFFYFIWYFQNYLPA